MPISCEPNDLIEASKCMKCIPTGMQQEVITYLLATMARVPIDPQVMIDASACLKCIPAGMQAEVQTMLLCVLAASGGFPDIITGDPPSFHGIQTDLDFSPDGQNYTQIFWQETHSNGIFSFQAASGALFRSTCKAAAVISIKITGIRSLTCNWKSLPNLLTLDVSDNPFLAVLDFNIQPPVLRVLNCSSSRIASITYTPLGIPNLVSLDCSHNNLTSFDMTGLDALQYLNCNHNLMTAFNQGTGSSSANLLALDCSYNQIPTLDIHKALSMTVLQCSYNPITSLGFGAGVMALQYLFCEQCHLTSIDTTRIPAIRQLLCDNNSISSLSLASNTLLGDLDCSVNNLTSLDVTPAASVIYNLFCGYNQLTSLTITNCSQLLNLNCEHNLLTSLDVTGIAGGAWYINDNLISVLAPSLALEQPLELLAQNNELAVGTVNSILVGLVGGGVTGGLVNLSGQTPLAVPTGAGATAVTTLRAESPPWTVTVDVAAGPPFAYTPNTTTIIWTDKNAANQSGNLAFFTANADIATVSRITMSRRSITAVSNLSSLPSLNRLDIDNNPALATCDLHSCASLVTFGAPNDALTTIDVSSCPLIKSVQVAGNKITAQADIDAVLAALDGFGLSNGICHLEGGTNSAPSAAGTISAANLRNKGWVVVVTP